MPSNNQRAGEALTTNAQKHAQNGSIFVCGLDLIRREVALSDATPVGSQISAAAGFSPGQQVSVLQWRERSLEDIAPNEHADLSNGGNVFIVAESEGAWRFTIDGLRFDWPVRKIAVQIVRQLAVITSDKSIYLERQDEPDKLLADDIELDLGRSGVERLASRSLTWALEVQGVKLVHHEPTIVVREALILANINPDQGWQIFLKIKGEAKKPLVLTDVVDLTQPGIEKIRLTPNDVINGDGNHASIRAFHVLSADAKYLDMNHPGWQTRLDGGRQWLVLSNYKLPSGFSESTVHLALDIPPSYPAQQLDMFYVFPAVKMASGAIIPATEAQQEILGLQYQRWSRHRGVGSPWVMAHDSILTHMALVESAILKEVQQ